MERHDVSGASGLDLFENWVGEGSSSSSRFAAEDENENESVVINRLLVDPK
jgi:hypothetical protein